MGLWPMDRQREHQARLHVPGRPAAARAPQGSGARQLPPCRPPPRPPPGGAAPARETPRPDSHLARGADSRPATHRARGRSAHVRRTYGGALPGARAGARTASSFPPPPTRPTTRSAHAAGDRCARTCAGNLGHQFPERAMGAPRRARSVGRWPLQCGLSFNQAAAW